MLKNISNVEQVIKYDGRQYPVEPGKVFDVKSMAPIGVIGDHEAICLEEKWEKETGGKLSRNPAEKAPAYTPPPTEKVAPEPIKEEKSQAKAKDTKKRGKK